MATYMDVDLVQYLCACGKKSAFCRLYLCKHCLALRCNDCLQHEVDTLLCPNCLETMPLAEAKLKKNRCTNCHDCPVCGNSLMTRATTSHAQPAPGSNPEEGAKTPGKKMYYMSCGFCRWTTRDVNLPDQVSASGNWHDLVNPNAARISDLLENMKIMAQVEKAERERKKYVQRRINLYMQDDHNSPAAMLMRKGLFSVNQPSKPGVIAASPTVDSFEPLPDEYFTQPADLANTTKLMNSLNLMEHQPVAINKLHPVKKHLIMKKSLRCKSCEHSVIKPDFNPSSIKFKLQFTALALVPEIRIMSPSTFTYNKETVVTLTLSNPSIFNMAAVLKPIESETDTDYCTAKVDLPKKEFVLAGRDETSMHVGVGSSPSQDFKDDPKVIVFRQANKIGLIVKVTPLVEGGQVKICFVLRHEYRSMTVEVLQGESKEPEVTWLEHKVFLTLGEI